MTRGLGFREITIGPLAFQVGAFQTQPAFEMANPSDYTFWVFEVPLPRVLRGRAAPTIPPPPVIPES